MTKVKELSEEFLSQLSEEEKDFLLSWKKLYEDKNFRDKLEKILKPVKKTIYDLEVGDTYCVISTNGVIHECIWHNDDLNKRQLEIGNIYLTRKEVENKLEYLKTRAELKRYARMCEKPVDWNDRFQDKFYCNVAFNELHFFNTIFTKGDNIHFTDKSILEKAIKEIGEERIIKYYFGIKGETK